MAYNRSAQRGTWFEEQQSMINSASDSELRSLGDTFDENFETTVKSISRSYSGVNVMKDAKKMMDNPEIMQEYKTLMLDPILDELRNYPLDEREIGAYRKTPEDTVKRVLALEDYWKGKTIKDHWRASSNKEAHKGVDNAIYFISLFTTAGIGHCAPNYKKIFKLGLGGIRKKVEEAQAKLDVVSKDAINKNNFYL